MDILFDHQIYNNQNYGGISRYFYELSKELVLLGQNCENSIYFSENEFTKDSKVYNARQFIPFSFKGRGTLKKYFNQKISERIIKKGAYDIFHPTYYDTYYLNNKSLSRPFVVTFYDLIHEKFADKYPEILSNMDQVLSERKILLKEAAGIIAISHSTKKDIIEYYGVDEKKIHVTHLANSMPLNQVQGDNKFGNYILFVGNRAGYKNFDTFIKAIQPLLKREKDLKVVCAGGGVFQKNEITLLNSLGIQDQVIQTPINDDILAKLYGNALFFVFPSLYEGFGIPVLEAFGSSCPAILSNVSSLPEVGEDAALYINPEDESDILSKAEEFFYNPDLRNEYRSKGLKQTEKFSWSIMASQTLEIYKSII